MMMMEVDGSGWKHFLQTCTKLRLKMLQVVRKKVLRKSPNKLQCSKLCRELNFEALHYAAKAGSANLSLPVEHLKFSQTEIFFISSQ